MLALVGTGPVFPDGSAHVQVPRPRHDDLPGPHAGDELQPDHRRDGRGEMLEGPVNHSVRHRADGRGFRGLATPALEPADCQEPVVRLAGEQLLRRRPLDRPLDESDAPVDLAAGKPPLDERGLARLERERPEVFREDRAVEFLQHMERKPDHPHLVRRHAVLDVVFLTVAIVPGADLSDGEGFGLRLGLLASQGRGGAMGEPLGKERWYFS